jgi:hypothetical protein
VGVYYIVLEGREKKLTATQPENINMKLILADDNNNILHTFDEGDMRETVDMFEPAHMNDSALAYRLREAVQVMNERDDKGDDIEADYDVA